MIELLLEAERAIAAGRADRAEVLYGQVLAADRRNSIAVVGLARVALERADDRRAYALARRALEIDPDNVAADRLAERMAEVMTTRGEAVPDADEVAAARLAFEVDALDAIDANGAIEASAEVLPATDREAPPAIDASAEAPPATDREAAPAPVARRRGVLDRWFGGRG